MQNFKIRFHLSDLLFYLLLVFSFYYTRNMICRLMMVVFFGYIVLKTIISKSKIPLPFFYAGFFAFILYGAVNIALGNVIDGQTARTMVVSLSLNFMMIVAIVQYIYMSNDASHVLRVTELGIFTTAFVVVLLSARTITQGRLGGSTEINSNMLAMLCVYGFIISMYLRKIGKLGSYSELARIGFYLLVILFTGSRKGLLMVCLAIAVVKFLGEREKIAQNILIGLASAIILYILIMNVGVLYDIIGVRVENLLKMISDGGTTTEASLAERQGLVQIGWDYIKEKPWTGYGYDCFKLVSGRGENGRVAIGEVGFYSHNNYIELLFGGGIIGFALYYSGVLYLLIRLLKKCTKNQCALYLLALLVSKLSVEYYYVSSNERLDAYILGIILGCVVLIGREKEPVDKQLEKPKAELIEKQSLEFPTA